MDAQSVWNIRDVVNIVAIIIGPIAAVLITLWLQNRKEERDGKIKLFMALLANRKSYPVSPDWAKALNLIDAVFQDNPKILVLWHDYYALLQKQNLNQNEEKERNHKYLELMSAIAETLGFHKLHQTDIDKFYIPQAHADQANLNASCQLEWLRVLKNTERLVVVPKENPKSD
jgi:hypothetical protein